MIVIRYLIAIVITVGSAFAVHATFPRFPNKSVLTIITVVVVAGLMRLTLLRRRTRLSSKVEDKDKPIEEEKIE